MTNQTEFAETLRASRFSLYWWHRGFPYTDGHIVWLLF